MYISYRLLSALYFSLLASPLICMQPQAEHNQWLLHVPLPANPTSEQIRQRNVEVRNLLGARYLSFTSARPLFNEIWVAIRETRPNIIQLLQGQEWFDETRLREDRPLPAMLGLFPPGIPERTQTHK